MYPSGVKRTEGFPLDLKRASRKTAHKRACMILRRAKLFKRVFFNFRKDLFELFAQFRFLLSLLFGQSLDQFSFTEDFSFTGVGIGSALLTILVASIIEEVGWKGYCEDSIGNYMNWFWESMIFGVLWSFWHFPLIFIKGTYQAGLMVNPLYVVNFFISGIPLGFIITWVYLVSDRSILACMVFHLFVNFMQEKIAMTPETKCVETLVVTAVTVIIVAANKDMFFETRHVGRLLESVSAEQTP